MFGDDFSKLSQWQRGRIERYVYNLTDLQIDKLSAMDPQEAAAAILPAESPGLGFFWWIIEAAYAVKVASDAKKKKTAAKKKADEMKKKAAEAIKKEKDKLAKITREMNELDKLKAQMPKVAAVLASPLPWIAGSVAIGLGLLYLITRRKKS